MLMNSIELTGFYFFIHLLFREKQVNILMLTPLSVYILLCSGERIFQHSQLFCLWHLRCGFQKRWYHHVFIDAFVCFSWCGQWSTMSWLELQLYHIDQPSGSGLIKGSIFSHYCRYVTWDEKPSYWISNHLVTQSSQISQCVMLGPSRLWWSDQRW